MSSEHNKQAVLDFCTDHSARNIDALYGYATPDATWWVIGRPEQFPDGGTHSYVWLVDRLRVFLGSFDSWEFIPVAVVADGDRVMLEATAHGHGPGRKDYVNNYIKHFEMEGGKIRSIREFLDPLQFMAYAQMPE